ncbi:MAG: type IX secretion system membrane protein PorP/SprF [Saprospiraceae bacterium]
MKRLLFLIPGLLMFNLLLAQQEPQFTQFMYNKLVYNPAYAGSNEATCIQGFYRTQWIGIEGAPTSMLVSFNMPLTNQRVGLGGTIYRNTIGIQENIGAEASYAYRFQVGNGFLGIGAMASVKLLRANFGETDPIQQNDGAIPANLQSKFVPNFGVGAYYHNQRFFVGLSVPRLLQNNIDFADEDRVISREIRHIYAMGGVAIPLSDNVKLQPQVLLKYVDGAPFDADANLSLILLDRYMLGASYRLGGSKRSGIGESVDIILGAQITNNLFLSFGYDITLSELKNYNDGTIEVLLRYCFGKPEGEEFLNPRFF